MTALDRPKFAEECLKQAKFFGAHAHYMLAVAQLRSGIDDAAKDPLFGPFQLKQEQWNKQRFDPDLKFEASDINIWQKQCALFACWTHKVHSALATANGEDPAAEDIYKFQWPGEPVDKLDDAFTATKGLLPAPAQVASRTDGLESLFRTA